MRYAPPLLAAVLAVAWLAPDAGAEVQGGNLGGNLVQQVQAAQLLADLITYTVDRADAQLADMRDFLKKNGNLQPATAPAPQAGRIDYMQLFRGALRVESTGQDPTADKSLANEGESQLYEELARTQYYNMHEFMHFNQQRASFEAMRARLESAGLYDRYLQSTSKPPSTAESGTSQPVGSEAIADRMVEVLNQMKESAWQQAQAKGVSRAQFEQQWPKQLQQYRESVESRIDGLDVQANAMGTVQPAGTPPPVDQAYAPPPQPNYSGTAAPAAPQPAALPPPVASPYTASNFAARNDELWYMWDFDPGRWHHHRR